MFWWKRLKIYQSNTYNICSYEACVKVFITSVAYFSGYWQVADLWTQSTRNREKQAQDIWNWFINYMISNSR